MSIIKSSQSWDTLIPVKLGTVFIQYLLEFLQLVGTKILTLKSQGVISLAQFRSLNVHLY